MLISVFIAMLAAQFAIYGAVKLTIASWNRVNGVKISRNRDWKSLAGSIDKLGSN